MYLNGLMLISAFLDGGTTEFTPGNDDAYVYYLPTYAAIAHYHGKHGDRPLREVLDEAEAYAARRLPAGARPRRPADRGGAGGGGRPGGRADRAVRGLRGPGQPAARAHPLLHRAAARPAADGRPHGRPVHRLGRDYGREQWTSDPSIDAIIGPYSAALNHYVRAELATTATCRTRC